MMTSSIPADLEVSRSNEPILENLMLSTDRVRSTRQYVYQTKILMTDPFRDLGNSYFGGLQLTINTLSQMDGHPPTPPTPQENPVHKFMSSRLASRFALVIMAIVTSILVGLFAPTSASAAPTHDWSGVAQCESSGNWSINTGNGYYGGLQFKTSTWLGYGGGKYAPNAHLATMAQQIEIAEATLIGQGKGAWGSCGLRLRDGVTPGLIIPIPAPAPAPAAAPAAAPALAPAPNACDYVVRSGDWLSKLGNVQAIMSLNQGVIANPNRIYVGQHIKLPTCPTAVQTVASVTPAPAPAAAPAPAPAASSVVDLAIAQQGKPYVWAASGPNAFDCSGLVQYVYGKVGKSLPHNSGMQFNATQRVSRGDLRPGDLVFFGGPIHHVGIYIGNGQMISAENPNSGIKIRSIDGFGERPSGFGRVA